MKNIVNFVLEKLHIDKEVKADGKHLDNPDDWEVNDILTATFHYSMTLVKFYKIIKRTGKGFTLKELEQKIVSGNGLQGTCVPIEDKFERDEDEVRVRVNKWGSVKVRDYYCVLWDGKPVSFDHLD